MVPLDSGTTRLSEVLRPPVFPGKDHSKTVEVQVLGLNDVVCVVCEVEGGGCRGGGVTGV